MGAANFYHVTESPLEAVVANLLSRALDQGWRIELRGGDPARLAWLDQWLWEKTPEDGFLPHGLAGGPQDAHQPVLLGTAPAPGAFDALMALDGAEVSAEEIAARERVWILFDGRDEAATQAARGQWKALTGAGAQAAYWAEEAGRWQKKAES
ncbi:DNA polymerase III subunit chi [Pseudothioclava arenosa]|uniref:DNA polymerase III subunit chi n=1 Tax=Pseudothioclava arenosa TaxID=1795308 RepID=A0A2A4CNX4_9RHOB|nr:DNA polymerase III subunit chi [Pseudothioclava arenosa]PCD75829.1 DNA polymerase III subunit chi [Pseudothioclava arenosa]